MAKLIEKVISVELHLKVSNLNKSILIILMSFAIYSCNNEDMPEKVQIPDDPVNLIIPSPVIIGQENEGCVANIIFLAEGFTDSEMTEFINLCDMAKQAILDMEPFASASKSLNFYRVNSPSITSGIKTKQYTSDCNGTTGITTSSQTPWSVFGNKIGLARFAGMEPEQRNKLEALYGNYATGDYVYTIIIANTNNYYGGAEFPGVTEYNTISEPKVSNMIVSKYDSSDGFRYLVRHEFGHSFGNLDDEYEDAERACAIKEQPGALPQMPKLNVLTFNPGTWFEGARYVSTGYWREWEDSIMRSDYYATTFSPKQREVVEQRLADAIGCL